MENLLRISPIYDILKKAEQGKRLNFEDGVRLFKSNDILQIGRAANIIRERKNGNKAYYITNRHINYSNIYVTVGNIVSLIANRHINYSNICKNRCKFCAFSR